MNEALREEASIVRGSAERALGTLGASAAVPALIEALRDEDSNVRGTAAMALGRIGASETVPALVDSLQYDGNSVNRAIAATALGCIGAPEAITAVVSAIPELIQGFLAQPPSSRVAGGRFFLRAAFRSGNLEVVQAFVEGFVSGIDNGEEAFMPHRVALDFLRNHRDPMILSRQPPEMREAVELLVSLFDQARTPESAKQRDDQ
jgi:hypothetical protein